MCVCVYVYIDVCAQHFSHFRSFVRNMLLLSYCCAFIFEVQMIYQVRENRDKGEAGLHS